MISVLILTKDEEVNIEACLASVAWCDDVVVLDSFSVDRTVELAAARGARVVQRRFDDFASQRNHGLREGGLKHDWVLHLDADERVTPELRDELRRVVATTQKKAFRVASKLILGGVWLRRAAAYPVYQVRLGRRDALLFQQVGHGQREALPDDELGTLEHPLVHHSFSKGLGDWFDRHNRYSSDEAAHARRVLESQGVDWRGLLSRDPVRRRRSLKDLSYVLPGFPLARLLHVLVWRGGLLDGGPGVQYALLMFIYDCMIRLKLRELRRG